MNDEEITELLKDILVHADYDLYCEIFEYETDPFEEEIRKELVEVVRKHLEY